MKKVALILSLIGLIGLKEINIFSNSTEVLSETENKVDSVSINGSTSDSTVIGVIGKTSTKDYRLTSIKKIGEGSKATVRLTNLVNTPRIQNQNVKIELSETKSITVGMDVTYSTKISASVLNYLAIENGLNTSIRNTYSQSSTNSYSATLEYNSSNVGYYFGMWDVSIHEKYEATLEKRTEKIVGNGKNKKTEIIWEKVETVKFEIPIGNYYTFAVCRSNFINCYFGNDVTKNLF